MRCVRKHFLWCLISIMLIMVITFTVFPIVSVSAHEVNSRSRTIRVGIFELNGFFMRNEDGHPEGYGIDYLNKLAEKTDWSYEYVWYDNWEGCVSALRGNEVDIVAPAGKTEERTEEFYFSSFNIGTESGALLTLETREDLIYEDFEAFNGLKIGCVESLIFKPSFLTYSKLHDFTPRLVSYQDTASLTRALEEGEVDAILVNLFVDTSSTRVLAKFGAEPFFFMLSKEDVSLLHELDEGLRRIKLENPTLEAELTTRYWPSFRDTPFTKAELAYISSLPAIKIGCRVDNRPISYLDRETGEVAGITRNILDEISRISGIRFLYIALPAHDVDYAYLRERGIQMVANVEYNQENVNSDGIRLTLPYMESRKVFVYEGEGSFDIDAPLKLAVSTGSQTLIKVIREVYPHFEVINYDTMEDCFRAVKRKEADALLQNQYVVPSYLARPVYADFVTVPVEGLEDKLCLSPIMYQEPGIPDIILSDDRLISILNKSIQQVSGQKVNRIIIQETSVNQYRYSAGDFFYQYRYFLSFILLILVLLICILFISARSRSRSARLISQSEATLRHITNNINGGVVVLSGDTLDITYANGGFLEMLGYGSGECSVVGQKIAQFLHPESMDTLNRLLNGTIIEKKLSARLKMKHHDKSFLPVLFNGTLTEIIGGKSEIYCVVMDLSEQDSLVAALSLEQKKYAMLMENSGDILLELNNKTNNIRISPLFGNQFGYEVSEYVHCNNTEEILRTLHLHQDDWEVLARDIACAEEEGHNTESTVRIFRSDNTPHWCRVCLYPMTDADGVPNYILGKILDIHEEVMERRRLEHISRIDDLSGLLNKNAFFEEANEYLALQTDSNTALVFIDMDNFKQVNDTLGHMAGDQAIRDTAKRLRLIFSNYDLLCRFGGDEFCILLKEIPIEALIDKLSWAQKKLHYTCGEEKPVHMSASIGAACTGGRKIEFKALLEMADHALYRAKENGKDQYVICQEEEPEREGQN